MAKFSKSSKVPIVHQVTFEEYLSSLDDLFPDVRPSPPPPKPLYVTRAGVPVFPGAISCVDAAAPSAALQVVRHFATRKLSG